MDMKLDFDGYNTLEVRADYSKGGINYFNGQRTPQGMKVNISAINVEEGPVFTSRSFMVGGGDTNSFQFLLFPMARNSKKKVAEANAMLATLDTGKIVELFKADDKAGLVGMIKEAQEAA